MSPAIITKPRSLWELAKVSEEVVEPYRKKGAYTTMALLNKALECVEVYKANRDSSDFFNQEEAYVCYAAASKIVSEVIPKSADSSSLESNASIHRFYSQLVDYLVLQRSEYETLRDKLQGDRSDDSLLARFQQLKNGATEVLPDGEALPESEALSESEESAEQAVAPKIDLAQLRTTHFISVDKLGSVLEQYPDQTLIIDLRSRREYELDHITRTPNVIQLDPVSIRSNYTCKDIETFSLVTSSDQEKQLFAARASYELVVCLDDSSSESRVSSGMQRLINALHLKSMGKSLKGNALILDGGYREWAHVTDPEGASQRLQRLPSSAVPTPQNAYDEGQLIQNVQTYFSSPSSAYLGNSGSSNSSSSRTNNGSYNAIASVPHRYSSPTYATAPVKLLPSSSQLSTAGMPAIRPPPPSQPVYHVQAPAMPRQQASLPPRISPLALPPPPPPIILTGLVNLGNSCYLNSGIQCLMGSSKLIQFFLSGNYRKHVNLNSRLGSKGILANEFASLCMQMRFNTKEAHPGYINPLHFKRTLGSLNRMFNNCDQQDCSEFLNYVLDSLHEDLNENGNHPKLPELTEEEEARREALPIRIASTIEWEKYLKTNFSIIVDIFQGQMMSQLRCLRCGATSTTYNAFSTLSLQIPKNVKGRQISLIDCFNEFVKPEVLEGDDMWFCPRCKSKQKAMKQLRISRLPQILVVHLKRFRMDNYLSKINNYVGYPEDLQLDNYWPRVMSDLEKQQLEKLPTRGQVPPFKYKLFGVINHYGNLRTGHYTSFVRKDSHGWCLFDDQKVHKHCKWSKVLNGDAYILFYERMK